MKSMRSLVRVVVMTAAVLFLPALALADLTPAYWLVTPTSDWGDYGTAANWAIGAADSETHAVPTKDEYIPFVDGAVKKFDLGGDAYEIGGLSSSLTSSSGWGKMSVSNGTLKVTGWLYLVGSIDAYAGSMLSLNSSDYGRSWGKSDGFSETVHAGATIEECGYLTYQKFYVTIEEGGTLVFKPKTYGPHPKTEIKSYIDNSGTFYAPNGIKRNYSWDASPTKAYPGTYFYQRAGVLKLGGAVARGNQPGQPFYFEFHGGTLEAEEGKTVTFGSDLTSAKFMEGSAMTVKAGANAVLDPESDVCGRCDADEDRCRPAGLG